VGRPHGRRDQLLSLTLRSALAALVAAFVGGLPTGAAAEGADSLIARAAALRPDVVTSSVARDVSAACGVYATCAAHALAALLGPEARVEAVPPPDTDVIRLVETIPSVARVHRCEDGRLAVRLDRFGRRVTAEILTVIGDLVTEPVVLDLSRNEGGRLRRALEVAALFTGPVPEAVRIESHDGVATFDVTEPQRRLTPGDLIVRIGPETASSAEVLALLLRQHAGARIVGTPSIGKDVALRALAVDASTRLVLPVGRISVPGETLAGGIRVTTSVGACR
jgi:hypothetical protein